MIDSSAKKDAIQALQGKHFQVKLETMFGSTAYDWCLKELPEGIQLGDVWHEAGEGAARGAATKVFMFFALEAPAAGPVKIVFQKVSWIDPRQVEEEVAINVQVVPYDEEGLKGFVKYSENTAIYAEDVLAPPYGYFNPISADTALKYGYPGCADVALDACGASVKYGYPALKYGYPGCFDSNASAPYLKYGYPGCADVALDACGAPVKYGYPALKYGYPGCA